MYACADAVMRAARRGALACGGVAWVQRGLGAGGHRTLKARRWSRAEALTKGKKLSYLKIQFTLSYSA